MAAQTAHHECSRIFRWPIQFLNRFRLVDSWNRLDGIAGSRPADRCIHASWQGDVAGQQPGSLDCHQAATQTAPAEAGLRITSARLATILQLVPSKLNPEVGLIKADGDPVPVNLTGTNIDLYATIQQAQELVVKSQTPTLVPDPAFAKDGICEKPDSGLQILVSNIGDLLDCKLP